MRSYTAYAFIITLFCFQSISALAQEDDGNDRKFELSIHLDNIFSESPGNYEHLANPYLTKDTVMLNSNEQELYYRPLMAGIGLRYLYSESLSFRLKGSYFGIFSEGDNEKNVLTDVTGLSDQKYSYYTKLNNLRLNIGAQMQENFEKGCLYYGMDIIFSYTFAVYQKEELVLPIIYLKNPKTYRNTVDRLAYGASPYIGFRYQVLPRVSVSTEMGFFYEYYNMTIIEDNLDVKNRKEIHSESDNSGQNIYLGPLGHISINFMF